MGGTIYCLMSLHLFRGIPQGRLSQGHLKVCNTCSNQQKNTYIHLGLRRYPSMNWYAGITNLAFMIEAHRGFRPKHLAELHKKYPVIRTGPNALSYGASVPSRISMDTIPSVSKTAYTQHWLGRISILPTLSTRQIMHENARSCQRHMR